LLCAEDAARLQEEFVNGERDEPTDPSEVCETVLGRAAQALHKKWKVVVEKAERHKAESDEVGADHPFLVKIDQATEDGGEGDSAGENPSGGHTDECDAEALWRCENTH